MYNKKKIRNNYFFAHILVKRGYIYIYILLAITIHMKKGWKKLPTGLRIKEVGEISTNIKIVGTSTKKEFNHVGGSYTSSEYTPSELRR